MYIGKGTKALTRGDVIVLKIIIQYYILILMTKLRNELIIKYIPFIFIHKFLFHFLAYNEH